MFDKLKHNILTIELIVGYLVYIFLIIQSTLIVSTIWIMFVVYTWLLSALLLNKYKFNSFLYIICSSGIILSISLFLTQGIEEIPYPEGALIFHIEGIAKSLFIFFVCSVPLLLFQKKKPISTIKKLGTEKKETSGKKLWEEATPEDLQSGNYEPL